MVRKCDIFVTNTIISKRNLFLKIVREEGVSLPRKDYKSIGYSSLPKEYVEAIDKLIEDPKFIREMKIAGFTRISRALVIRVALKDLFKRKGVNPFCYEKNKGRLI